MIFLQKCKGQISLSILKTKLSYYMAISKKRYTFRWVKTSKYFSLFFKKCKSVYVKTVDLLLSYFKCQKLLEESSANNEQLFYIVLSKVIIPVAVNSHPENRFLKILVKLTMKQQRWGSFLVKLQESYFTLLKKRTPL